MVNTQKDAAFTLAEHVLNTKYEDIPGEAIKASKLCIRDILGTALAASTTTPACREMAELAQEMGGKEESTIIAYGGKVPSYMAAFVNAALAHSLNYDDVFDSYAIHPSCTLFSASIAVAERLGKVSGKEFLTTYTLVLDVMGRLGRAVYPPVPIRDWGAYGWLTPQLFGYFGAALGAGRLLGLTQKEMVNAIGLTYCQTAGNFEPLFGVGADKGIYPAYPAKAGVLSVLMAQKGIAGPQNSLQGQAGLYNVYFQGMYDADSLTSELSKTFRGTEVGFYPYPCNSGTHVYISSALRLAQENNIQPEAVKSIKVFAGGKAQRLCEPLEIRRNPRNMSEAQMNVPFTVAVALARGKPCIKHFTKSGLNDPQVLKMSNKVALQVDPRYDTNFGTGISTSRIEITLNGGKTLSSEYSGFRYGHYQNPMSESELLEKFRDCVSYSLRPIRKGTIEELISVIDHLEELDNVSRLIELIHEDIDLSPETVTP